MQTIWHAQELSITQELHQSVPLLVHEFLTYHADYFDKFSAGESYQNPIFDTQNYMSHHNAWKGEFLRYILPTQNIEVNNWQHAEMAARFPTAVSLIQRHAEHCGCCGYSSLDAHASIKPHADIENLDRKYIRIHVPLIVPPGDCFLQVGETRLDWSDIFAFDNQTRHHAYNNTSSRRLIFIMDITREFLDIPAAN